MKLKITKSSAYVAGIIAFTFGFICHNSWMQNDMKCFIGFLILGIIMSAFMLFVDSFSEYLEVNEESENTNLEFDNETDNNCNTDIHNTERISM